MAKVKGWVKFELETKYPERFRKKAECILKKSGLTHSFQMEITDEQRTDNRPDTLNKKPMSDD